MQARGLQHYLRRGGVIAYPTESCFGLGCDPASRRGVQRVLRIKGRPQRKGLILIGSSPRQFDPYIAPLTETQRQRMAAPWPGPHTWLVPAAPDCPRTLTGKHPTIALRVTAHRAAARLCASVGMALVSTSANRSGGKAARSARECRRLFGPSVRVLPGLIGKRRRPSTIQDLESGRIFRA
jgi:L-threonylcarbamoyladenylate synthase